MSSRRPSFPLDATGTSASITSRGRRIRCWASSQVWSKSSRADQRASSYLAMSQGAHAGRLLLAEYREDLKRAIFELAERCSRSMTTASRHLLCDVNRAAFRGNRYPRRTQAFRHQCMRLRDFRARHTTRGDRPDRAGSGCSGASCRNTSRSCSGCSARHGYIRHALDCRQRAAGVCHCAGFRQCASGILGSERRERTRVVRGHDGSDPWRAAVSNSRIRLTSWYRRIIRRTR